MEKATRRKTRHTSYHPVTFALLNLQSSADVIIPRIAEHEALSSYQEGRADCDDSGWLAIAAHVGLYLAARGVGQPDQPIFAAGLDLLETLGTRSAVSADELDLLRRMVAAHDRQREQVGRGDYLKALKALQPRCRA